ncbi:MAG: hypothetical protein IJ597_04730 [Synergistaceae bacterium]|nr:hypothetical protein [Synergistaceae bacterium]
MAVGLVRGVSGIDEKEKKQIQGRIDELTILSKPLFSQIKKVDDEATFSDLIMPYFFSVRAMLDYIQETIHDKAKQEAEINKLIDAFDGAYLWSRVKPYPKETDNNKLKTINIDTNDSLIDTFDSTIIEMLDDTTLFHIQMSIELLKQPVKRRSEASTETRDKFFALLLDEAKSALEQAIEDKPIKNQIKKAKELVLELSKIGSLTFDEEISEGLLKRGEEIQAITNYKPKTLTPLTMELDRAKLQKMGIETSPALDKLTGYDRAVYDRAISLYLANCDIDLNKPQYVYITSRDIYCCLNGNKDHDKIKITPEELQKIEASLRRLSIIRVCINSEREFKKNFNVKAKFEDYLLNTSIASIERNGKIIHNAICINRPPVLYLYAHGKNQIGRMPIKMLDTPQSLTPEYIETRDYLLRWVASIKNPKSKLCSHRKYSTIYDDLGVTRERYKSQAAFDNAKAELRKKIKNTLSEWKAQGEISDYFEKKEGNTIAELHIIPKKHIDKQPSKEQNK